MKVEHILPHLTETWLKTAVLLLIGLIVAIIFRRSSPEFRLRLWMPLFGIILVTPILLWAAPRWKLIPSFTPSTSPLPSSLSAGAAAKQPEYVFISPNPEQDTPTLPTSESSRIDWKFSLFLIWTAGVLALVTRLGIGLVRLRRFRAHAVPTPRGMGEAVSRYAAETGIQRTVRVVISPRISSPFAWDFGIPTIALPDEVLCWNEVELEMVLRHELVHLKRHDSATALLAAVVTILHWFNPLAWKAAKNASELREEICDRMVLAAGCDPTKYANLLFHQAQSNAAPYPFSATAVAKPGTLEKRVTMILKNQTRLLSSGSTTAKQRQKLIPSLATICLIAVSATVVFLGVSPHPAVAEDKEPEDKQIHITSRFVDAADTDELPPLMKSVNAIVIPHIQLAETPLKDALAFLDLRCRELGPADDTRVNIILDSADAPELADAKVSLNLWNVSVAQVFKVMAQQLDLEVEVESHAVVFRPRPSGTPHAHPVLGANEAKKKEVEDKLKRITIPKLEFQDTKLGDAIRFLAQKSRELDADTSDPNSKGINFAIANQSGSMDTRITLRLENIPLSEAVRYTANLAQMSYRVEANVVVLFDPKEKTGAVKVERTVTEP